MATDDKKAPTPAAGSAADKAKEAEQKASGDIGVDNPMLPDDRNLSTPTGDVSPLNTVGNPSPGTEAQRQWAANTLRTADPGTGNPSDQTRETNTPKSRGTPIESVVVKKHYNEKGALIETGSTIYYQPLEGKPYPWPLMRPVDNSLNDKLQGEYDDAMEEKRAEMRKRSSTDELVRRISERS